MKSVCETHQKQKTMFCTIDINGANCLMMID